MSKAECPICLEKVLPPGFASSDVSTSEPKRQKLEECVTLVCGHQIHLSCLLKCILPATHSDGRATASLPCFRKCSLCRTPLSDAALSALHASAPQPLPNHVQPAGWDDNMQGTFDGVHDVFGVPLDAFERREHYPTILHPVGWGDRPEDEPWDVEEMRARMNHISEGVPGLMMRMAQRSVAAREAADITEWQVEEGEERGVGGGAESDWDPEVEAGNGGGWDDHRGGGEEEEGNWRRNEWPYHSINAETSEACMQDLEQLRQRVEQASGGGEEEEAEGSAGEEEEPSGGEEGIGGRWRGSSGGWGWSGGGWDEGYDEDEDPTSLMPSLQANEGEEDGGEEQAGSGGEGAASGGRNNEGESEGGEYLEECGWGGEDATQEELGAPSVSDWGARRAEEEQSEEDSLAAYFDRRYGEEGEGEGKGEEEEEEEEEGEEEEAPNACHRLSEEELSEEMLEYIQNRFGREEDDDCEVRLEEEGEEEEETPNAHHMQSEEEEEEEEMSEYIRNRYGNEEVDAKAQEGQEKEEEEEEEGLGGEGEGIREREEDEGMVVGYARYKEEAVEREVGVGAEGMDGGVEEVGDSNDVRRERYDSEGSDGGDYTSCGPPSDDDLRGGDDFNGCDEDRWIACADFEDAVRERGQGMGCGSQS